MKDRSESDLFWNGILSTLSGGRVVPIVGEALTVIDGAAEGSHESSRTVSEMVAEAIARRHGITTEPGQERNLSAVLSQHDLFFRNRPRVFDEVTDEIDRLSLPIPSPLANLAALADFKLFVSTTFDGLLPRALDQARFGGRPTTRVFSWSRSKDLDKKAVADALAAVTHDDVPVVIQLFGDYRVRQGYALSEVEKVEFVHDLRRPGPGMELVLRELQRRPVLMLGNCFPDWLLRMLVRLIRHPSRGSYEQQYIAESAAVVDPMFRLFFCGLTPNTDLIADQDPVAFVAELARRWHDRHQRSGDADGTPTPARAGTSVAVFISYAKTDVRGRLAPDARVASMISEALQKEGITSWIDSERLKGGRDWELQLRGLIDGCTLFMPLISRTTESRDRGVFVKEWKWAVDVSLEHKDWKRPFFFPVVIDDLDAARADGVLKQFKDVQITPMRTGSPDAAFVAAVKDALMTMAGDPA